MKLQNVQEDVVDLRLHIFWFEDCENIWIFVLEGGVKMQEILFPPVPLYRRSRE